MFKEPAHFRLGMANREIKRIKKMVLISLFSDKGMFWAMILRGKYLPLYALDKMRLTSLPKKAASIS